MRVANRGRDPGVGHTDHDVGFDRGFAGQHLPNTHAVAVEGFAEETAVGPREIDHFEDAELGRLFRPTAAHRLRLTQPEVDDFARLDVPIEARANDVEAAGLAAHHPAGFTELTHVAKDQGANAMAIPQGKQPFRGADHQAEGSAAAAGCRANGAVPITAGIHGLLNRKGDQL